jgi:hypothetical protein
LQPAAASASASRRSEIVFQFSMFENTVPLMVLPPAIEPLRTSPPATRPGRFRLSVVPVNSRPPLMAESLVRSMIDLPVNTRLRSMLKPNRWEIRPIRLE